jgi:quercetin dioxygenase-like cupin family protein
MRKISLDAAARELSESAGRAKAGRSAQTVFGGHEQVLRQTMVALVAGAEMAEHEAPGEATVHVLRGRIRLNAPAAAWEGRAGDLIIIPPDRHSVAALEDSVILLTVAMRG